MRIDLIARTDKEKTVLFARRIGTLLETAGHEVRYHPQLRACLGITVGPTYGRRDATLTIAIGGDGTILRAVQQMKHMHPIVGINCGGVGFLADVEPKDAEKFARELTNGFWIEERIRIDAAIGGAVVGTALNEIAILSHRPAKLLEFTIIIDGTEVQRFKADGLLVSTPTGSTAYAMSAGGPIVDPAIRGYLVVPVAPYLLSSRPQMISEGRKLEVRVDSQDPVSVVIDGQLVSTINTSTVITFKMSDDPAIFMDVGRNFFQTVGDKLRRHQ